MNGIIFAAATPHHTRSQRGGDSSAALKAKMAKARRRRLAQEQQDAGVVAAVRAEAVANAQINADAHRAAARDQKRWTPTAQWTPPPDTPRW